MAANTDVTMATIHFFSRDVQSLSLVINLQSRVKNLHMAAKHGLSLARQGNLLHSISFDSSLEIEKTLISVQCICKSFTVIFIKTLAMCHSKNWFFNIFQHTKFLIIMSVCLSIYLAHDFYEQLIFGRKVAIDLRVGLVLDLWSLTKVRVIYYQYSTHPKEVLQEGYFHGHFLFQQNSLRQMTYMRFFIYNAIKFLINIQRNLLITSLFF